MQPDGTVMVDGATIVIGTGRETSNEKGDHIFLGAGATEPIVLGAELKTLLTELRRVSPMGHKISYTTKKETKK